jgi:uncharacterized protein
MRSHLWTVLPRARHHFAPRHGPLAEVWRGSVVDQTRGAVELSGLLCRPPGARTLVVLVHGLGGSAQSPYVTSAAAACDAAGAATLRLNLRGADGVGGDFYHAGLTADLAATLASPALAAYSSLHLLGFSLGGHLALRYAAEGPDPRVRAVAAVCSPLDLQLAQRGIDRRAAWPYRAYILARLKRSYATIAAHSPVPTPAAEVMRVRSIRDFDRLTVVPRFGFADPEDYYAKASAGPLLPRLSIPARLVACATDPMVPRDAIAAAAAAAPGLELRWVVGGHVGFPGGLDLGEAAPRGLETQLAAWLLSH